MGEVENTPVFIQVLGYIPGLRYFSNFYKFIIGTADVRADKYPLMVDPDKTAAIVFSYLLFCLMFGPKYMRRRATPIMTQGLLCFYNLIAIYINGFLALTLTYYVFTTKQSLLCEPINTEDENASWVMTLLYIFHLSKIVELVDTIFLVWKKKTNQLSFLHVYHHSTIVAATWIGVKFSPGGTSAVISMINSWVHVLMYIYYQLTAIRVNLSKKYKKFLTLVQMGQFCYTLVVCANGLWIAPCNYPEWILWWLFLYMISFLLLFSNFFYKTYTKRKAIGESEVIREGKLPNDSLKKNSEVSSAHLGSNHFANGDANGFTAPATEFLKNGQASIANASLLQRTTNPVPLMKKITKGFEIPQGLSDFSKDEIIFNDVIGLTRVRGKQQLSAEVKFVNSSIEVTTSDIPSRQDRNVKEPTKVRKLKKKKSKK